MTNQSREAIEQALLDGENAPEGVQPAVLMDRPIDHSNVGEYTSGYVNDSWAPKLKELIDGGWIVFRIQTELDRFGHRTMAYLAKMKSN